MASCYTEKNVMCYLQKTKNSHTIFGKKFHSLSQFHTRIHEFYFFFLVFFLPPPFPERLRFTDFGDRSLDEVPFVVAAAADFFMGNFNLFKRRMPSFPFALKCC
jgi:hypothetical protein